LGGGYHVQTVASAKQGLHCLKRIRFDVVVIGGYLRAIGLTEWLSEAKRLHPDLPVIVNEVKWPVGRGYLMGSPGAFHCLVRSLQTQEVTLRERVEEVVQGRDTGSQLILGNDGLDSEHQPWSERGTEFHRESRRTC
jgi:DNA-binding NtrC family response regulator